MRPAIAARRVSTSVGGDDRDIAAAARQRRLGRGERQHQRGGQQRRQLGQRDGGQLAAFGDPRLRAEARRLGAKRGGRIGEVADHRRRELRHDSDRHRARERPWERTGGFAPRQAERNGAAAGQHHVQRPLGDRAQPRQIVVVDEFGGERQDGLTLARSVADEQHRVAAAQRDDRRVKGAGVRPGIGRRWARTFDQLSPLDFIISRNRGGATLRGACQPPGVAGVGRAQKFSRLRTSSS